MKRALFLLIILKICIISLHAQTEKWKNITLDGEDEPLLEGTTWRFQGNSESVTLTYEFRAGGRLVQRLKGKYSEDIFIYKWGREGNIVRIVNNEGTFFSEGKYYPQTQRIMLTTENYNGEITDETWVLFQGSSITSVPPAPAPSSTTNVYVQPSSPTQSTPPPTTTTTTLRTGRYACSGTNVTIELLPTTRFVTLYSGSTTVGNGQYNINGNTIVITIIQASGVANSMQGKTYAYTIMSDTSFSGSGETWYRR